jgi:ferrochelatase
VPAETAKRVAIVLFNLGGPDRPQAVGPFLRNLFRDPAILRVPLFVRPFLAWWITRARLPPATANYALLGGRSPLLELTRAQAAALEAGLPKLTVRCFVVMRYWHPLTGAAVQAVKAWRPDEVVLLPLYPQYSSTTTGSSLTAWREHAARAGLVVSTRSICCYPSQSGYVASLTHLAKSLYQGKRRELPSTVSLRVLFSAHGLPESIVRRGDPYQSQIERTVAAVLSAWEDPDLDWVICYQSRATPQKWLGPSTDAEVERAAHDNTAVLVVPVAFVSEHSETLVELDVEYRILAEKLGMPAYYRVATPGTDQPFIEGLADLVRTCLARPTGLNSAAGKRICAREHGGCPCTEVACSLS